MITLQDMTLRYGKREVVRDLSLTLQKGSTHGLVGLNGSGKTTLIRGLCRIKPLQRGQVTIEGQPLTLRDVAYLETSNFFYSRITGREYLSLFQQQYPRFSTDEWNELFGLPLDQYIEQYSTGMKKQLAFLGIIATDKPFLILDEPFNGIDLETTEKLKMIIRALREKGTTILVTSHILESLTSLCDAISYLEDGKIQYTFSREEFTGMEDKIFSTFRAEHEAVVKRLIDWRK